MGEHENEIHRLVHRAHERIDVIDKDTIINKTTMGFQERRLINLETAMTTHMAEEAKEWEKLNLKIDNILRYKWIIIGVLGTLWILSDSSKMSIVISKALGL